MGKNIDIEFGGRKVHLPGINPFTAGLKVLLLIIFSLWIISGIYIVGPDEIGVIRRFGKAVRNSPPGIHYHLPSPIEMVDEPKVTEVKRLEVGFRTLDPGPPAKYRKVLQEAQMLTGDENIVNVEIIVQYKVKEPRDYLFNIRSLKSILRHATEAALRQVVGNHPIDEVLTTGKFQIQEETKALLQSIVDRYESGLMILAVQLQDVHPPEEVVQAFKDVASAKEDKDKLINQAKGYRNDVIPKAKGEAEKMIREAEGYHEKRIKTAEGDAERFIEVWKEYRKAKEVTRQRLYLETMERIMPEVQKIIVTPGSNTALLNLMDIMGAVHGKEEVNK
jgi:membrane protease subunit HflK